MMPEMDGIALLRAALDIDPDLVGIIMTGQGTIATAVEAMKVGALDYILKPFKLSVILPVLARALAMRQLRLRERRPATAIARARGGARGSQQGGSRHFPIRCPTICARRFARSTDTRG